MAVRVQTEDFDHARELASMRAAGQAQGNQNNIGAIVSFIGLVREFSKEGLNDGDAVSTLTLEHYPGMTEKALQAIEEEAKRRWDILESLIIHRIGTLKPQDQIVLVMVSSAHRGDAFQACEFMMDYLKTQAPFWKKEVTGQGARWVEAKTSDDEAILRWK